MSEATSKQEPPMYFANLVTLTVTVDEAVLEFRRFTSPHKETKIIPDGSVTVIPAPTHDQVMAIEPIARVVLTYTAAQALRDILVNMLAPVDKARRAGEKDPWKMLK
jgi:hypothetical protein